MGILPPSLVATTLTDLDATGIAIVYHNEEWFITFYQQMAGPYDTPEMALEAGVHLLAEQQTREGRSDCPSGARARSVG